MQIVQIARGVLVLGCTLLFSGCASRSDWKPLEPYADRPYAHGTLVQIKFRSSNCTMCTTGSSSESAFFAGEEKYDRRDIGADALALLQGAIPKTQWTPIGKNYQGQDRFFLPIRVFVASLDPLIIMTIPWHYKTGRPSPVGDLSSSDEVSAFANYDDDGRALGQSNHIPQYWPKELNVAFELRGTLPRQATQVRVIAKGFDQTIDVPATANRAVTLEVQGKRLHFTRADGGKVLLSFNP